MHMTPDVIPPLLIGAMREKTLRMAGRVGDGTILTSMSSPAYIRWAREHIQAGMAEAGRQHNRVVVYLDVKVGRDGSAARAAMRQALAERLPWSDVHLQALGIADEVDAYIQKHEPEGVAEHMPDEWLDALSAAGTPEQVHSAVKRWFEAGADSVVFQPLNGDPGCLGEYIRYLMPLMKMG
jgi:5,10-methylenetetrahydromethanopterin reductase